MRCATLNPRYQRSVVDQRPALKRRTARELADQRQVYDARPVDGAPRDEVLMKRPLAARCAFSARFRVRPARVLRVENRAPMVLTAVMKRSMSQSRNRKRPNAGRTKPMPMLTNGPHNSIVNHALIISISQPAWHKWPVKRRWCKRGSPLTVRCDALNPRFQQDVVGCRLASGPAACGAPAALRASRPKRKRQRFQLDSTSTALKLAVPFP